MRVGILCAGDREFAPFLPLLEGDKITEKAMLRFHEGKMEGREVVALYSGVCKVNAAIAAQILIDSFHCDCIINAGTAGGMDEALEVFDTVIATEIVYHDVDEGILTQFHPWMDSVFFRADEGLLCLAKEALVDLESVRFGRMATGEQFIAEERRDFINERFRPLSVDMESAAIAHVCYVNKVPFLAVRTVTDTARHSGADAFEQNCDRASKRSVEMVRRILRKF